MWEICTLQVAESQEAYVSSNGDSIIEAYTPRHGLYCYPLWHLLHPAEAVSVFWGISEYMKRAASGMEAAFNI